MCCTASALPPLDRLESSTDLARELLEVVAVGVRGLRKGRDASQLLYRIIFALCVSCRCPSFCLATLHFLAQGL